MYTLNVYCFVKYFFVKFSSKVGLNTLTQFHVVFGPFDNKEDDYSVHELSSIFWIGS